ncbi:MAG: RidA family protein [Chloroflexi bacterium]|nr:RidA family protein [Chloroflexota bacterium]MDA1240523.1 RidA family protein [Chloroflexota bacterium]
MTEQQPRQRISSGGPWEARVGYSRAVRVGDHIWVSGTTGTTPDGYIPPGALSQTRLALDTIESALTAAGSSAADVVAMRIYVTEIGRWEQIALALRERFGDARPAMSMVEVSRLIRPEHLVEIEVEAVAGSAA